MFCPNCGAELLTNAKFCSKCGVAVGEPEGPPQPPPSEPVGGRYEWGGTSAAAGASLFGPTLESVMGSLWGFLTLSAPVIHEVRINRTFTIPALLIAGGAILATGLGGLLHYMIEYSDRRLGLPTDEFLLQSVLIGSLLGLVFWLVGTGVTILVLRSVHRQDLRPEEVLRVAGVAAAPLAVGFFIFIPGIGFGVGLISAALLLTFTTLAIHKAFDVPMERALLAAVSGFTVWALVLPLLVTVDHPFGPGLFVFDWAKDWLERY